MGLWGEVDFSGGGEKVNMGEGWVREEMGLVEQEMGMGLFKG